MTTAAAPSELIDAVVRRVDPVEVWLFGSRARGDAAADSDWDLYVVVEDGTEEAAWLDAQAAAAPFGRAQNVGVDVVVRPWSRSLARRRALGTLDEIVDHEGVRVYARAHAPPILDVPPVNSAQEWLDSGRKDVAIARLALEAGITVQQGWEKAIKGLRTLEGRRSWKTHALEKLVDLQAQLESDVAFRTISRWAIEGRYEGEGIGVPQEAEVRRALHDAEAALDALQAALTAT